MELALHWNTSHNLSKVSLETLHGRLAFKVSSVKFAVFPKTTLTHECEHFMQEKGCILNKRDLFQDLLDLSKFVTFLQF
jgi:hypothetical protein